MSTPITSRAVGKLIDDHMLIERRKRMGRPPRLPHIAIYSSNIHPGRGTFGWAVLAVCSSRGIGLCKTCDPCRKAVRLQLHRPQIEVKVIGYCALPFSSQ